MTNARGGVMLILGAVLLTMLVGSTEARRRPPPVARPPRKLNLSNMSPQQIEEAATQAAGNIVLWGTTTIFQLKEAAQIKKQFKSRAAGGETIDGNLVRFDAALGKHMIDGAIGGVFIMMNSPALGRLTDSIKRLMGEDSRKNRILSLHSQLSEAHGGNLGAGGPARDPPGFWEGALRNKELAAAHLKFKTDIEALSNSALAKKAAASAEAYHEAMLNYASSEPYPAPTSSATRGR